LHDSGVGCHNRTNCSGPIYYSVTSVAYSLGGQYTASASDNGTIHLLEAATRAESIKIQFTDQPSIDNDGWLHGEENELVLWIPELHRPCLHRPSTIWIAGKHETRLDLSDFAYGLNWALVHYNNLSK
jgi:WD40 repeat protein